MGYHLMVTVHSGEGNYAQFIKIYRNSRKVLSLAERLGIKGKFWPDMGPFTLKGECGIGITAVFLQRTLDKGKRMKTIQFDTAQKIWIAFGKLLENICTGCR